MQCFVSIMNVKHLRKKKCRMGNLKYCSKQEYFLRFGCNIERHYCYKKNLTEVFSCLFHVCGNIQILLRMQCEVFFTLSFLLLIAILVIKHVSFKSFLFA